MINILPGADMIHPLGLAGNSVTLVPLTEDNISGIFDIISDAEVKKQSLLYMNLNLTVSIDELSGMISGKYGEKNKLYIIRKAGVEKSIGLIGMTNVDWIQQRGSCMYLMKNDLMREKELYEPLKLLIANAVKLWNIRKILVPVFKDDSITSTVLKGFGFVTEGTITEFIRWDNDFIDIIIMSLNKRDFHCIEL